MKGVKENIDKIIHKAKINNDTVKLNQYNEYLGVLEKAEHAVDWLKANIDTSPDDYYNEQVKHVQHGIIIKGLIAADVHRFKKKERRNRNKLRKALAHQK